MSQRSGSLITCEILGNFQNYLTAIIVTTSVIQQSLNMIPPQLKCVATLPCEILMLEK